MSRLGGQFAGILSVQVPEENETQLQHALESLKSKGLTIIAHADRPAAVSSDARTVNLEIVGQDRPGIVREISRALAMHEVNVEELHTEFVSAAMSGENLFKAQAWLSVPPSCDTTRLRQRLENIAADLIVDLSFEEMIAEQAVRA